jgi:LytS/YehU family sensor histidine kinase
MLVSTHVFLEMLHYGVWIVALPVIGATGAIWNVKTIPIASHSRGFPKLIAAILIFSLFVVAALWAGFSVNYAATRDIYFTVAIAHVLAEAPFLLRMI